MIWAKPLPFLGFALLFGGRFRPLVWQLPLEEGARFLGATCVSGPRRVGSAHVYTYSLCLFR